jgi:Flp pilus assembly protein TadD
MDRQGAWLDDQVAFQHPISTEAIRLKPDDADTFNNRGIARSAKGDSEGALQDFNEAIRLRYNRFQKG